MSTYYELCEKKCGIVIRSGTLPEMLSYVERMPDLWHLYRVSRRGNRRLMTLVDGEWVADPEISPSDGLRVKLP